METRTSFLPLLRLLLWKQEHHSYPLLGCYYGNENSFLSSTQAVTMETRISFLFSTQAVTMETRILFLSSTRLLLWKQEYHSYPLLRLLLWKQEHHSYPLLRLLLWKQEHHSYPLLRMLLWKQEYYSYFLLRLLLLHLSTAFGKDWAILYSGKLSREKTFANWRKYDFRGENFHGLVAFAAPKYATPQISQRKLLRIATKPQNSQKFFPQKFSAIQYIRTVKVFLASV